MRRVSFSYELSYVEQTEVHGNAGPLLCTTQSTPLLTT
jgi:hypothetical protein